MSTKEARAKLTRLEIAKIVAPWLSLPIGTLILALVPQVRAHIWPATPKLLLLVLLVVSLSINLVLIPYALRARKRRGDLAALQFTKEQEQIRNLEDQIKSLALVDLDEIDTKILLVLANREQRRPIAKVLGPILGIHVEEAQHRLDRLRSIRYINYMSTVYAIDRKGREYLFKKQLLTPPSDKT